VEVVFLPPTQSRERAKSRGGNFIYLICRVSQTKRRHPDGICADSNAHKRKFLGPLPFALRRCAVRKSSRAREPSCEKQEKEREEREKSTIEKRLERLAFALGG
jgi:hypothetical protein